MQGDKRQEELRSQAKAAFKNAEIPIHKNWKKKERDFIQKDKDRDRGVIAMKWWCGEMER